MNNFEFANPVKVVFGKGTIARLSALIPAGSKVLMVYGGGSIKERYLQPGDGCVERL